MLPWTAEKSLSKVILHTLKYSLNFIEWCFVCLDLKCFNAFRCLWRVTELSHVNQNITCAPQWTKVLRVWIDMRVIFGVGWIMPGFCIDYAFMTLTSPWPRLQTSGKKPTTHEHENKPCSSPRSIYLVCSYRVINLICHSDKRSSAPELLCAMNSETKASLLRPSKYGIIPCESSTASICFCRFAIKPSVLNH